MNIEEVVLTISQRCDNNIFHKSLTYRGGENILIKVDEALISKYGDYCSINFPINILKSFTKITDNISRE
jgi:hypothetical protein